MTEQLFMMICVMDKFGRGNERERVYKAYRIRTLLGKDGMMKQSRCL
jgi:hypothetical protein